MKVIFIAVAAVLAMPVFSIAQNRAGANERRLEKARLTGKVVNSFGEPLPGATIYVHDIRVGTVADNDGHYLVPAITPGRYLVEVTHQGYASATENLTIEGNIEKDFTLTATVVEQEGVTVTGVTSATRIKQSPQPVSVMKKSELLQSSSTNLMEALSRKTGVSTISTGPAISKPVIRGLGYNRVVTINDGVRQEGQQWGDEHGIEIDEYSVQKAEILKGPASLMYGSDAMAGVINFITNQPIARGTFKGNLLTSANSNNGMLGLNANVAAHALNGFNWNVYTSVRNAADYRNRADGKVFNSGFNEMNVGGYAGVNKNWGYSHLIFSSFNQKLGVIEGDRDSATGSFIVNAGYANEHLVTPYELKTRTLNTPYQSIHHTKIASDNNFSIGRARLSANVGFQVNERQEFGNPYMRATPGVYFKLSTLNYNLGYHLPETKGWRTSIGVNGMYQQNRNLAEEKLIPEYNLFDFGGFVYSKKTFDKLTVSGGLRGDMRSLTTKPLIENSFSKFTGYNRHFSDVSGSAGITYEPSKTIVLKANVARGFRAPSIAELSSNGAHEGTNRYEYGQNNLRTETSVQGDVGFELNTLHFSFELNGYYNNINHYIFYRKLENSSGSDSTVDVEGNELTAFRFDQSAAHLAGFEADFDLHPHPLDWLHFENRVSFVSGAFAQPIEGAKYLPFIPAPRLVSELRGDFKKVGSTLLNTYLSAEMDATAKQANVFYAYNTETSTPGYVLFNLSAGGDVVSKGTKLFSLYLALNNVTDVIYQNHLSRLKYTDINNANGRQGVFNMGRNFNIKLNIPLDFKE